MHAAKWQRFKYVSLEIYRTLAKICIFSSNWQSDHLTIIANINEIDFHTEIYDQ